MLSKLFLFVERCNDSLRRRFRSWYYSITFGKTGRDCVFGSSLKIFGKPFIELGDEVVVNDGVVIQSCDGAKIQIGSRAVLSYDCMIVTGGLDRNQGAGCFEHVANPVTIEKNVWLGARAIVLPGVTIGEGAVIAAGAIVSSDIPPNTLAAGIPAKVVRQLE